MEPRSVASFNKQTRIALSRWKKFEIDSTSGVTTVIRDYRASVISEIASVTDWDTFRLAQVSQGLDVAKTRFVRSMTQSWRTEALEATALAISGVDKPLLAIGAGKESLKTFVPSARHLMIINDYVPSLIVDVADDVAKGVQGAIRQSMLGGVDNKAVVSDMIRKIASQDSTKGRGSVFQRGQNRLRTIFRTESNRIHNLAREQRIDELSEPYPGLGKKWIHRDSVFPRSSHAALHGKVIYPAKKEKFILEGMKIEGPHDLSLPAEEVINCHCTVIATFDKNAEIDDGIDPIISDDQTGMTGAKKGVTNELTEPKKRKPIPKKKPKKVKPKESPQGFKLDKDGLPIHPGLDKPLKSQIQYVEDLCLTDWEKYPSSTVYQGSDEKLAKMMMRKNKVDLSFITGSDTERRKIIGNLGEQLYTQAQESRRLGIPVLRGVFEATDGAYASMGDGMLNLSKPLMRRLINDPLTQKQWKRVAPKSSWLKDENVIFKANSKKGLGQPAGMTDYFDPDAWPSTVINHEFGHHIHQQLDYARDKLSRAFNDVHNLVLTKSEGQINDVFELFPFDRFHVSKYAGTNGQEWFAENWAMWKHPVLKKSVDPEFRSVLTEMGIK